MIYKHNDLAIFLKCATFIFLVFPFISHIYGAVFPALYDYKIGYISAVFILFIFFIAIHERKIVYDTNVGYFIPFLLIILADSIYSSNLYFFKYFAYVFIYFLFLKKFFLHDYIMKLYVNILVVSLLILLLIYFITLTSEFDLFSYFEIAKLKYISTNAPINNWSEDYRGLIFYLLVYVPGDTTGILPIPRLYGFSREPGMFATFLIPGFWMACYFKMKLQAFILTIGILLSSSFAGFFVLALGILLILLPRVIFKRGIIILFTIILVLVLFRHNIASLVNIARVSDYVLLMDRLLTIYFSNVGNLSLSSVFFILEKLSYIWIIYHFYNKVKIINSRIIFIFLFSFVIMVNKANELISPLFLFYLLFIDYAYQKVSFIDDIKLRMNG